MEGPEKALLSAHVKPQWREDAHGRSGLHKKQADRDGL